MKRKIALFVLCGAAVLIVFGLLAYTAYAPHTTAAASSSSTMLDTTNSVAAPVDASMASNTTVDDAEEPVLVPVTRGGHYCDGESASSGGY